MIDTSQSTPLTTSAESAPRLRLHYLDGLRGLAALFVVFHHASQGPFGRSTRPGIEGWLTNWILYGHLSVDVFIVLSGFCLALPVAKSKTIRGGVVAFYKRRARRILPPLYFALLISLPVNFAIHKIGHHPLVTGKAVLANLFLLQDWLPAYNVLDGPLWSVAAEWKIYFLFPLLIWVWKRFHMLWMLAIAALIGYGITLLTMFFHYPASLGNTCPWYVFLFALGVWAGSATAQAVSMQNSFTVCVRNLAIASLTVLIVLLLKYPVPSQGQDNLYIQHLPAIDAAVGALTAAGLLLLYERMVNKTVCLSLSVLSWAPLVRLGTFAYSIYLIHIPLLWLSAGGLHRLGLTDAHPIMQALVLFFVVIPAIIVLAYGFFLVCEKPFLNTRKHSTTSETERDAILSPAP